MDSWCSHTHTRPVSQRPGSPTLSPSAPSPQPLHLGLPFGGRSGLVSRGVGRTWRKAPASSLPLSRGPWGELTAAGVGFSLPLPNGHGCRCRWPSPAGGADSVDTPSWQGRAVWREEAPERRPVLRGALSPSSPSQDATGPGPSSGHAASQGCERRLAAWQSQVGRQAPRVPRPSGPLSPPAPLGARSPARFCLRPQCGDFALFLLFSLFPVANFPLQLSHVSRPSLLRDCRQPLPLPTPSHFFRVSFVSPTSGPRSV